MEWRQEYNGVVAAIDTLMRVEGAREIGPNWIAIDLRYLKRYRSFFIFWADDEAEVFINGYRVAQTRLTPVQVEIPKLYLREQNVIQAHCWDTDGVESGFMAGLYVKDERGQAFVQFWLRTRDCGALAETRWLKCASIQMINLIYQVHM